MPGIAAVLLFMLLVPTALHAQANIAGMVKDSSGGVLPGVTVEASSPALIEKVRTAVTDTGGQYRIENLRPGTYLVTFALTGFSMVRREGLELTGSFTATVNADLTVGALSETITVTGETPIVDVQGAQRQQVVTKDVITALPTAGGYSSIVALAPGVVGGSADVSTGPCACTFSAHGAMLAGRANTEGRTMLDGLLIAVPQASSSNYFSDTRNAQEVTVTVSGNLGEVETGGPVLNLVPRTGGNTLSGSLYGGWSGESLQGSNYTPALQAAGVLQRTPLTKNYDFSGALGGPIKKDRVWFFGSSRRQGSSQFATMYHNKNAGDPTAWTYVPDLNRQAFQDRTNHNFNLRLTSQLTPRNKLNFFWDEQYACKSCVNGGQGALNSPEAGSRGDQWPIQVRQLTWSSPITNRLLIEVGAGQYRADWGGRQKTDPYTGNLIRMTEQCTAGCPDNGNIPGLIYRSQSADLFLSGRNGNRTYMWRAILSHVTGSRTFKAGYTANLLGDLRSANRAPNALLYRVNNGVPNQFTMYINDFQNDLWMRNDGFFVQEGWTTSRLTVQGALRFDHAWTWAPPQQEGPATYLPQALVYPRTPVVDSFWDIDPRASAVYDLFGNGKTAIKATFGRYLEATVTGTSSVYALGNPTSRIAQNVSRAWTDANRNFGIDCDILNPAAQDLRAGGGDFCGAFSNSNFGTTNFSNTLDPEILKGWGVRPSDWNIGLSVQHEILPRVSVEAGYFRRWFRGFLVTDNLAVGPDDFGSFSVTAPADPRLPQGGGYTVSGLYDVNPALFGRTNNFLTFSDRYGDQYTYFNGIDVSVSARLKRDVTIQGGFSGGRTTSDSCEVRAKLPEIAPLNPFCHVVTGYLPHYKALASYVIPRVDLQLGLTFTSKPGLQVSGAGTPTNGGHLLANLTVPSSVIATSLGRALSGSAQNATINLIEPGSLYGERLNELDLRLAKVLKVGRTRANVGVDIFNLLNSAAGLSYNQAFIPGGAWLTPTAVMTARFAKISAQFDF
ncbi:MAG: carboxypeptidase-like regulatory domain-containing protein [Acidobacteriota bacterium]